MLMQTAAAVVQHAHDQMGIAMGFKYLRHQIGGIVSETVSNHEYL